MIFNYSEEYMSDAFIDYDGKKNEDGNLIKNFKDNVHISSFIKCIDEANH